MTISRNIEAELDALKSQMEQVQRLVGQLFNERNKKEQPVERNGSDSFVTSHSPLHSSAAINHESDDDSRIYYSGQFNGSGARYRWEPQQRQVKQLMNLDGDRMAKVLAALGHKQRLDILRSILEQPLTGAELVERLNMGTTGQLYHHIKALQGSDLLVQEDRGGQYSVPGHRTLPLLLLFAAVSDLLDTTDYMELADVRNDAGSYVGGTGLSSPNDPHLLLAAVIQNSLLEHQAGYCTEMDLILHKDNSITAADNGRGIPVKALSAGDKPRVQQVLSDFKASAAVVAPGKEKGISMAVVNALSLMLSVEIRREGKIYRQDYRHGIPQSGLLTVGSTKETGTSITFLPDRELFGQSWNTAVIEQFVKEWSAAYPRLTIRFQADHP